MNPTKTMFYNKFTINLFILISVQFEMRQYGFKYVKTINIPYLIFDTTFLKSPEHCCTIRS